MSYLVLARKWRPKGFDDLIGQDTIIRILRNAIEQSKIAHAYIFSGPRGVGKTSTARILSKAMNCINGPTTSPCGECASCVGITEGSSVDVIEIDGASNNSVDDIRDLREKVKYAPSGSKYKLYIIDEAHMLSGSAFNALLKTIEEPPPHVIFVLATTALRKIPATILSRCQHMPFRRITGSEIRKRLGMIAEAEEIRITDSAVSLIARSADGSMRDSLTILDQLSAFSADISDDDVKSLLGMVDLDIVANISKALISGDRVEIIEIINMLSETGTDMKSFAKELVNFFRNLLVMSVIKRPEGVLDLGADELSEMRDIVSSSSEDQLALMLSELINSEAYIRNASSPRLALEMSLIKTSFLSTMKPLKKVIENIDRYGRLYAGRRSDKPEGIKGSDEQTVSNDRKREIADKRTASGTGGRRSASSQKVTPDELLNENSVELHPAVHDSPPDDKPAFASDTNDDSDISDCWEKTLERIGDPLASKISKADIELKGEKLFLTLNGGHGVFEDAIRKNIKKIEKIFSEEAGREIGIKLVKKQKNRPNKRELKDKIIAEPIVRETMELFEGRVVDVMPAEKTEHETNGGKHV